MTASIKAVLLGDAMIPSPGFEQAWRKHLGAFGEPLVVGEWEPDWSKLQYRRLEVEKTGPEHETVPDQIVADGADGELLAGLFVPVSSKVMDAMPNLRVVGVSRAGVENVNVAEATSRGIAVFHVMGRNAHAVSDFAIGMMLAEARNIGRAHHAIKTGEWRKTFSNSAIVPEISGRTIGLVGFGYIGSLVAKKLSGFDVRVLVYDPYTAAEVLTEAGVEPASLETVLSESDIVSLHARLSDDNKGMIGAEQIALMKPTAILVNTARAGLIDEPALAEALRENKIAGAALDVFSTEPIPADHPFLDLDNVTLTTHLAGTTADALANSPFLLMADIAALLTGGKPRFLKNPEVLQDPRFAAWLESVKQG
ncbi:MAG: 2-hydroxyacid dehydrogenase [Propioniciclava sp.]|uniref:2-hydroxyacid dehydrogenase n=1 Tax=Propioniciclava sp. TaxID=2038686 RepID=UPI0039E62F58